MSCDHEILNRFLVEIFNEILRTEERCITQGGYDDLSIRELHVIEAVCQCAEKGKNTASDIAALLDVGAGHADRVHRGPGAKGLPHAQPRQRSTGAWCASARQTRACRPTPTTPSFTAA